MQFRIVPITESHLERFRAAVDAVARERKYLAFLEAPPLKSTQEFVRANIAGGYPHVVALVDEWVIGWCDTSSLQRPAFAHSGVLGMGVVDGFREQGVGEALMRAALETAKTKGLTRVELTVREHNLRAKRLYEKTGFIFEGVKRRVVRIDGVYEDLICMGLLLE